MTITVATKEQLSIVQDLAHRIWPDTYGNILSKEQFDYMMPMMYSKTSLENQLENKKIFLLIADNEVFVGFASYELNLNNSNKTKLHKLYVLPEMQGKGVGKKLIDYIKEIAISNLNSEIVLTVNRFNTAKDFYLKNGFIIIEEKKFDIGNGYFMDDFIMEKSL